VLVQHESVGPEPAIEEILRLLEDCTGLGHTYRANDSPVWGKDGIEGEAERRLK
jgi:hypothetical protein